MRKEPRLRFTDEERADPALEKPIRKVDRAAVKADKAQAKIPKKQVRQKAVDLGTGKVTTKLVLEDKKKPPSKLSHAVRDAPGDAALGKLHKEIRETEQDNVGVESAHKSEEAVETGARLVREGYRSHKLKPYRKAAQAEQKLEKANVNALELVAVEADYAAKEAALQAEIDNIEISHPGYDEYRYDLDMIGHDPHELAAYLSAVLQGYTRQSAQAELERVFDAQYQLTLTEEVEVRYRTETRTDSEGNSYTVEVPYLYSGKKIGNKRISSRKSFKVSCFSFTQN